MTTREARLNETFVVLADTLVSGFDLTDLMHTLVSTCVELLGADAAGLLLADGHGRLVVMGSTDEATRTLELFELQNEDGPCLDSYRTGEVVSEPDLATSRRWLDFSRHAVGAGFRAVDALPLRIRDEVIGALNLLRAAAGPGDTADIQAARALADVAAIGILQERLLRESQLLAEQLQKALTSRVLIEQAKGVLAEQGGIDVAEAFDLLRRHARSRGRTVRDCAQDVLDGRLSITDLT